STSDGAVLLCRLADPASGLPGFRDNLIGYFQRSLSESDSYEAAISVFTAWGKFSSDGTINSRTATSLLGRALEPARGKHPMSRLHPGFRDMDSVWGQAFEVAIRGDNTNQETGVPGDPLMVPETLARQETDTDTFANPPATPSLSPDAGTDTGVQAG